MSEELENCPFCGGKIGSSSTLCGKVRAGNGLTDRWWCKRRDYDTRHLPPQVADVIEAAKLLMTDPNNDAYRFNLRDAIRNLDSEGRKDNV